ncbi:unnamed protein product [Fusarium graminearum]|uniref:Uncharacterized protein n=1 Tax=Gibberella zeae TaxID=5518 RepID=A0A4V6J712_GIBZA|nr:unnamed protein product [Fusarium graminearum]CAG1996808.1 unnamed protein product [Fusarium graminearum]CAG2005889.1 unnamed protein product [Fusarium graminearum]VTO81900.1 unnamed protein product [Fusarium graminearum]
MCSILRASNRPASWTLDQPDSFVETEEFVNSCEFRTSNITTSEFSSTGFQKVSETSTENIELALSGASILPDANMTHSIVKIEARFENNVTGVSVQKFSTGLLVNPDLVVTGSEAVFDDEYHLGTAKQVTCYLGYRSRGSSDSQRRYGQRVVFSADWTEDSGRRSRDIAFIQLAQAPAEAAPVQEEPVEQIPAPVAAPTEYISDETQVPEPIAQPEPEPVVEQVEAPAPVCVEPVVEEPKFDFPAPAVEPVSEPASEKDYVEVQVVDETPDTSVAEETDPFYETIKTISQIDTKTLNIESSLIDDVGQSVSVAAGALVHHVTGAEAIMSGKSTKLAGISERALLAEASLQAVLAIEQSDELDEIIANMKQNWTANAPQVDQLSVLLAPYLSEAARCIIEYYQEDDIAQAATAKSSKRRNLGLRQFPTQENTKAFVKGIFGPTLLLSGRQDVFSSLGPVLRSAVSAVEQIVCEAGKTAVSEVTPKLLEKYKGAAPAPGDVQATRVLVERAIMADVAYQALSTLSQEKLQALKVIPLDNEIPQCDNVFDLIKYIIQMIGPVCLHDAKQAIHKFFPLLLDPVNTVKPTVVAPMKTGSSKLALRDFLSSKKGSVKTI